MTGLSLLFFYRTLGGVVLRFNLSVEHHASKIYTRAMFEVFRDILYEANYYEIEEIEKKKLYTATHTQAEKREKWSRVVFKVQIANEGMEFICECGHFDHVGLLCSHVLKVQNFFLSCVSKHPSALFAKMVDMHPLTGDGLYARQGGTRGAYSETVDKRCKGHTS